MNDLLERLAFALAAMGVDDRQIIKLHEELARLPNGALVRLVQNVRKSVGADEDRHRVTLTNSSEHDARVGSRVERLLRVDGRLSTKAAVTVLTRALANDGLVSPSDMPPLSKKSFADWVDRLVAMELVSPKELLRVATLLRNALTRGTSTDWLKVDVE